LGGVAGADKPLVEVQGAKSLPHANVVCISAPFGLCAPSAERGRGIGNINGFSVLLISMTAAT